MDSPTFGTQMWTSAGYGTGEQLWLYPAEDEHGINVHRTLPQDINGMPGCIQTFLESELTT